MVFVIPFPHLFEIHEFLLLVHRPAHVKDVRIDGILVVRIVFVAIHRSCFVADIVSDIVVVVDDVDSQTPPVLQKKLLHKFGPLVIGVASGKFLGHSVPGLDL